MANKITVTSAGTVVNANVTPDTAMYYSNKSREWAVSNRIVDNTDYSSKYYANESKKQADISTAKATEVVESGNTAVSNIENARDNAITDVNTAGATQVALATEQATIATNKTSEVVASGNTALANIDTAKNNAITSITNQETTSKTSLIDESATQVGLIQNEGATQVANVQSTGFYMRDDKLYYINSQGEETEFKSGGSGLEICDIGMALYIDETKGLRRYLNGQIVDINTNTQAFLNRLKEITTLHPSLLCTEEEWQTAKTMSAFGQVGKFVFNYSGENIVSVRLPRVVNVQGLFDLQNLGMTVAESLPNINGTVGWLRSYYHTTSGAFTNGTASGENINMGIDTNGQAIRANFNASLSSSIYQDGAPVQQEAIQYPYFIQIATGSETENNIVNDIELNNPYSLFDSKYSDHELNNLSWLKSSGQWNAKAVYTDAYDKLLKVYNGTETVEGLSVKLSTETYTDYDFVLNTAEETFRLPLLDGSEDLPGGKRVDLKLLASGSRYIAPANGWLDLRKGASSGQFIQLQNINNNTEYKIYGDDGGAISLSIECKKGDSNLVNYSANGTTYAFGWSYAKGNGSLYFYVGETVQNANLINAGRIGEILPTKTDKVQAAQASMPSNRFVNLTLGASGTTYTAPANGWFWLAKKRGNTSENGYIYFKNITKTYDVISHNSGGSAAHILLPVQKRDNVICNYTLTGANEGFRFIYTEGEI